MSINLVLNLILLIVLLVAVGLAIASVSIINEGNQALVERFGKYKKTLNPGINFIIPFVDVIVLEESMRERILDIPPQSTITKDSFLIDLDIALCWRIKDLKKVFYETEDVQVTIREMVSAILLKHVSNLDLSEVLNIDVKSCIEDMNQKKQSLGIQLTDIFIQRFSLSTADSDTLSALARAKVFSEISMLYSQSDIDTAELSVEVARKILDLQKETGNPEINSEVLKSILEGVEEIKANSPRYMAQYLIQNSKFSGGLADVVLGSQIGGKVNNNKQADT